MPTEPSPAETFIRLITDRFCERPDEVDIQIKEDDKGTLIMLYVAQEDIGRMIGKNGDTATAIRTLLRALGSRNNAKYSFKVNTK